MEFSVNYLAVLVAGIASMVLGYLWYGPLFGKQWMALSGMTDQNMEEAKAKGMGKLYFVAFIGSLVMAYVLAHFVQVWNPVGAAGAFTLAFWTWLGFVATVMLGSVLWEGKSVKLYFLNAVYQLLNIFVMALILVYWG